MSTVLITGASRGIGRAAALLFGKNGWNVAVNYRASEETAQSLKRLLSGLQIENDSEKPGEYDFYASDSIEKFITFADSILPCTVRNAEQIAIEEY